MDRTAWNRHRYTLWAPFYDFVALFHRQRRRSIELLDLRPGEQILLVGAGTGADLPFLPPGVAALATELSRQHKPSAALGLLDPAIRDNT